MLFKGKEKDKSLTKKKVNLEGFLARMSPHVGGQDALGVEGLAALLAHVLLHAFVEIPNGNKGPQLNFTVFVKTPFVTKKKSSYPTGNLMYFHLSR
jgi:hypothetical protein